MTSGNDPRHGRNRHATAGDSSAATGKRGVRSRDWILLGVVTLIVIGLGVYLLARPASPSNADDPVLAATKAQHRSSPSTTPRSGEVPMSQPTQTSTSASPSAGSAPRMSKGAKATKIGPLGDLARRQANDPMAEGRVDAPVVMVMFADFRCPFCAQFSRTTEPKLVSKYVKSGVLRIEWRDMPIFGPQSKAAAVAGRAAAAQDRFFEFTQAVYAGAPQTGHPNLTTDALIAYAKKAGVPDIAAFTAALADPAAAKAVTADLDQASSIGVPSTPAFIINGYPLLGAQPLSEFTSLIDKVRALS